jgi:hypothetical protein
MVTQSSNSLAAERSDDLPWVPDTRLRLAALQLLHASNYATLRRLQCEVAEAVVSVHGVVPSYYLKQMAQTVIQQLDAIQGIKNLVEVRATEWDWTGDTG